MDVVGFGENSVDLIATMQTLPQRDDKGRLEDLITLPGGQIATAMVGCARLGLRAQYVGSFGGDRHGEIGKAALTAAGVDIARCRTIAAPTRTALILVETDRQSRIVLARRDDALDWAAGLVPVDVVRDAKVLLVDATDIPASVAMATAARAAGVTTMADVDGDVPGLDVLLRLVDILVVPTAFAPDLRHLHQDSGARVVVATLAPDGAVAWDGTVEHYAPGFVVPVADTTGAGDAFRAGLITALLDPPSPRLRRASPVGPLDPWTFGPQDLDFANACAALNCLSVGAQTGLPTRAEVEAFVTSAPVGRSKESWAVGHMVSQRRGQSSSGEPA